MLTKPLCFLWESMCSNWIRWHTNIASFASCKRSLLEHYLPRKNLVGWWLVIKRPCISIGQQLWNQNFPSNNHFNIGCFLWFFIVMLVLFSFMLLNYSSYFHAYNVWLFFLAFTCHFVWLFYLAFVLALFDYFLLFLYVVLFCSSTLHSSCSLLSCFVLF